MVAQSKADIEGMQAAGRLVRSVFSRMRAAALPGVRTMDLDRIAALAFSEVGALSAPALFYDFPGATCISVNEEAAHGIPGDRELVAGDLINIDVSAQLDGYVADMGESFVVPGGAGLELRARERICRAVASAVRAAIKEVRPGAPLGNIGRAVQRVADRMGYGIVRNLGSHGVGRSIHEEPSYVPLEDPWEKRVIEDGLVFTIEPFFTTGRPMVRDADDGWTLKVRPGELVAQFEQTVIARAEGPLVVTAA